MSASASVKMELRPMQSQVVLAVVATGGILAMVAGWQLLSSGNFFGLLFFGFAVAVLIAVLICWDRSRRDVDMASGQPTKVITSDGASVVTDSRLLASADSSRNLGLLLLAISDRQPLPMPKGKVADDGTIVLASEAQAQEEARRINAEAQIATLAVSGTIRQAIQGASSLQRAPDMHETPPANTESASVPPNLNSVGRG